MSSFVITFTEILMTTWQIRKCKIYENTALKAKTSQNSNQILIFGWVMSTFTWNSDEYFVRCDNVCFNWWFIHLFLLFFRFSLSKHCDSLPWVVVVELQSSFIKFGEWSSGKEKSSQGLTSSSKDRFINFLWCECLTD